MKLSPVSQVWWRLCENCLRASRKLSRAALNRKKSDALQDNPRISILIFSRLWILDYIYMKFTFYFKMSVNEQFSIQRLGKKLFDKIKLNSSKRR